jgi:uncharacterized protein YihD (DUF1040 family)
MRDPNRTAELLNLIRSVWDLYPDLRLGQLISNTIPEGNDVVDLFYLEDEKLVERIKATYFGGGKIEYHQPSIQATRRK